MVYGEGLTGGNGGQGNLVHLLLVHWFEEEEEETLCDRHPLARILLLPHMCKNQNPSKTTRATPCVMLSHFCMFKHVLCGLFFE